MATRTLLVAFALVAAVGCSGAPPELSVDTWAEEARRDSDRWQAATRWCDARLEHPRCQPILRAKAKLMFRGFVPSEPNLEPDDDRLLQAVPPASPQNAP